MIKIKKEYIVLFAIILALSLYLVLRNPDRTHYALPKIPEIMRMDISKIEISTQDGSISISIKGDDWLIAPNEYLASSEIMKQMLNALEEFPITALVSESKNYKAYDLNEDKKITVKAWTGDTLSRDFSIGKWTQSYKQTFVRLADDPRVYQLRGNIRSVFDQTIDRLRDKTIFSFDSDTVREVHIAKGQNSLTLLRKEVAVEPAADQKAGDQEPAVPMSETVWLSPDGNEADKMVVKGLVDRISNLRCRGYVEGRTKEDFKDPIYSVKLNGEKEYTFSIFEGTDKNVNKSPAVASGSKYPFLLDSWLASQITKSMDSLLGEPGA
jgi:hypothetical protein